MIKDYETLTLAKLQEIAKSLGIKSIGKYRKKELINLLSEMENSDSKDELLKDTFEEVSKGEESVIRNDNGKLKEELKESECISESEDEQEESEDEQEKASETKVKQLRESDAKGVLDVLSDGYGFLRTENEKGEQIDYYVSASHIKQFQLRTGDRIEGISGELNNRNKYAPIIYISKVNGTSPKDFMNRLDFDDLVPVYANQRLRLECDRNDISNRIMDLVAPIGKGQRGLIVSPPKAGKTTLLKSIVHAIEKNYPEIYLFILLIDERPEEVTDFERSSNKYRPKDWPIQTEVLASTFDKSAQNHIQIAEGLLERTKRLVESGQDVVILMDSLTRLSRAYNITTTPSGRTLSGGLDPIALYPPKRFFGAARNIEGSGSLTILATCLKDTGSRMDDMIYEEFKGTGNMEVHLSRGLSELRIFPAIDIFASGTRREDLLLSEKELQCMYLVRKSNRGRDEANATSQFVQLLNNTANNDQFCDIVLNKKA